MRQPPSSEHSARRGQPIRTCAGCGRKAPQRELLRFTAPSGVLVHDPAGRAPGRGVYTCARLACFERAQSRRAFSRTLRRAVSVPTGLMAVVDRG